jgi:hypothetical protein
MFSSFADRLRHGLGRLTACARRRVAVCSVALLLAGCVGVPQEQLVGYAASFSEAQSAGLLVYDAVYAAVKAEAEQTGSAEPSAYPVSLGPGTIGGTDCETRYLGNVDITARCEAFSAALAYNEALVALGQGASTDAVIGKVEAALAGVSGIAAAAGAGAAGAFITGPIVTGLTGILEQALRLRDQAELKAKLDEGAPLVSELLRLLREDSNQVYDITRQTFVIRLTELNFDVVNEARPLLGLVAGRAAPTDTNALVAFHAVETRFDAILARQEPVIRGHSRLSAYLDASGTPLSPDDVARLTVGITPLEVAVQRFDAVAAEWQPIRQAIVDYQAMLAALERSFLELLEASNDPFAFGGGSAQLAQTIAEVRRYATEISGALR